MRRLGPALLFSVALSACSRGNSPPEQLQKYVLDQPPQDVGAKQDVSFDGKVTLLGARVNAPPDLSNFSRVTLTLYWRSDAPVDADVRLSTHLLDGAGKLIQDFDYVGPLRRREQDRQALGPGRWSTGKVYVDEQIVRVPSVKWLKTQTFDLVVSLADGDKRLPVVRGAHDQENRVQVAELSLVPPAPPPAPVVSAIAPTPPPSAPAPLPSPPQSR
jgi:hypothetical protein